MYQVVLFDLDGTLLNTLEDLTGAVNHVLIAHGLPLRSCKEIRSFVGNGIRKLMERSVPEGVSEEAFEVMMEEFSSYYKEHALDKTAPYEGIMEALYALKEKGISIGIVSNKFQPGVDELREHFFKETVEAAVGGSPSVPHKPDPTMVYEGLRLLKGEEYDPSDVLYIGDSLVDAATARNAGCDYLLVSWGFVDRDVLEKQMQEGHPPLRIVDTPAEILDFFEV